MASFSQESLNKLATCDERLQRLFAEVIKTIDCKIDCGHRGQVEQDVAFAAGTSQLKWPNGPHNGVPSRAVDVLPWPVEWPSSAMDKGTYAKSLGRWYMFVGFVLGTAQQMGIKIRVGADWNGNFQLSDQKFDDLPHFEVVD